ncbi:unnamed protein product, partial [Polarella glacialis]
LRVRRIYGKVGYLDLPGGGRMPMSGLGMCTGRHQEDTAQEVFEYLMLGGRHLDDALAYENVAGVGAGVRRAVAAGIPREEIFVTIRIPPSVFGFNSTLEAVEVVFKESELDYVDLLQLHSPLSTVPLPGTSHPELERCETMRRCHEETWRALKQVLGTGLARHLGVANFNAEQMEFLLSLGGPPVAVNQLEFHPWVTSQHRDVVRWCHQHGIAVTAYASLEVFFGFKFGLFKFPRFARRSLFGAATPSSPALWDRPFLANWTVDRVPAAEMEPISQRLEAIAGRLNKTVAQVLLRWAVQQNVSVIPGASSPQHIRENLELFDWELADEDMHFLEHQQPENLTTWRWPFGPHYLEGRYFDEQGVSNFAGYPAGLQYHDVFRYHKKTWLTARSWLLSLGAVCVTFLALCIFCCRRRQSRANVKKD